jgi:acyl carrier protein
MHEEELIEQVREVLATTLGVDSSDLPDDVSQDNCERWTSLSHMVLLVALEEQFECIFSMDEMTTMTSLERIVQTLRPQAVQATA